MALGNSSATSIAHFPDMSSEKRGSYQSLFQDLRSLCRAGLQYAQRHSCRTISCAYPAMHQGEKFPPHPQEMDKDSQGMHGVSNQDKRLRWETIPASHPASKFIITADRVREWSTRHRRVALAINKRRRLHSRRSQTQPHALRPPFLIITIIISVSRISGVW